MVVPLCVSLQSAHAAGQSVNWLHCNRAWGGLCNWAGCVLGLCCVTGGLCWVTVPTLSFGCTM